MTPNARPGNGTEGLRAALTFFFYKFPPRLLTLTPNPCPRHARLGEMGEQARRVGAWRAWGKGGWGGVEWAGAGDRADALPPLRRATRAAPASLPAPAVKHGTVERLRGVVTAARVQRSQSLRSPLLPLPQRALARGPPATRQRRL